MKQKRDPAQTSFTEECILDSFAGGGYSGVGNDVNDPLTTVTHEPRHSMVAAHIAEFNGNDKGQSAWEPLRTITASAGEFGAVVRANLPEWCGGKIETMGQLKRIVSA